MAHKKPKKLKADKFLGVSSILALQEETFGSYISEKDVAMIMFYDPKGAHSKISKTHFLKAAKTSRRENVSYAAVNCEDERRLCISENVKDLPSFKIYSRGNLVTAESSMSDYRKIVQILDEAPVLLPKPVSKTMLTY